MAQQEIGQAGKTLSGRRAEGTDVVADVPPAVLVGEIAVFLPARGGLAESQTGRVLAAFAVSQVVVPHHGEAVVRQKPGKGGIAPDVFRDAVDQLDHSAGRAAFGKPLHGVDPVDPVTGGKGKFSARGHSIAAPFVIK